jgi:hypothetical protein
MDPDRSVRIRRGSEGYEIRPRRPSPPRPASRGGYASSAAGLSDSSSWELAGGAEGVDYDSQEDDDEPETEYEVDEEGDRRRVGARYKYYVREEDSSSDELESASDEEEEREGEGE